MPEVVDKKPNSLANQLPSWSQKQGPIGRIHLFFKLNHSISIYLNPIYTQQLDKLQMGKWNQAPLQGERPQIEEICCSRSCPNL